MPSGCTLPQGDIDLVVGNDAKENELLVYTRCPNGGAQLHAGSACFACTPFMGREQNPSMCIECVPDVRSQGVITTGESCTIPCVLGQRPLGSDVCEACTEVPGTFYDSSLPERTTTNATTWTATRCVDCENGKYADSTTGAVCLPCLPGQYAASPASTSCSQCPVGKFSSDVSSTACELCAVGGFCASEGAASASMTFEQCPGKQRTRSPLTRNLNEPQLRCLRLRSRHLQPGHGRVQQQLVPRVRAWQGQPGPGQ